MTVAFCLLLSSCATALVAPRLLRRYTTGGAAPRLGLLAWTVTVSTVVGSWFAAVVALLVSLATSQGGRLLDACLAFIRAIAGEPPAASVMLATAIALVLWLGRLVWRLMRGLATAHHQTRRHTEAVRIVGRRLPELDAVVLDASEPAAYCLPGRPATVVVTTGAVEALRPDELAAVLEHERAHLVGRHHLLLALVRGLQRTLPGLPLLRVAAEEIARLLEMRADDVAAGRHGTRAVLGALLVLSRQPVPSAALGVSGRSVVARAVRLVAPPSQARRMGSRLALSVALAVLVSVPFLTTAFAWKGSPLCMLPA